MSLRPSAAQVKLQVEAALAHKIPSALTVNERPTPEMLPTGIAEIDQMTGGIARGTMTEICGAASSGRTSVLLSIMAGVTRRGEAVALVDASDAFHPESAEVAGVEMRRVLWVRCSDARGQVTGDWEQEKLSPQRAQRSAQEKSGEWWVVSGEKKLPTRKERLKPVEQALKATDLLLQSGGFGLIVVDLGDVRPEDARRVPLTTWFRFRRAIENTPTTLVIVEQEPYAKTCATLVMELKAIRREFSVISHQSSDEVLSATCSRLSAEQIAELLNCATAENRSPQRTQRNAEERGQVTGDSGQGNEDQNLFSIPQFGNSAVPQSCCARPLIPTHSHLLHGMRIQVEISRGQLIGRKPVQSVPAFESRTDLSIC
jgi:hypothetical protein